MISLTCRDCPTEFKAKTRHSKLCPTCKVERKKERQKATYAKMMDPEHWTPEARQQRQAELEAKRAAEAEALSKHNAQVNYLTMPFISDEEELAWLIKEQEKDARNGDRVKGASLDAIRWGDSTWGDYHADPRSEELLDEMLERV